MLLGEGREGRRRVEVDRLGDLADLGRDRAGDRQLGPRVAAARRLRRLARTAGRLRRLGRLRRTERPTGLAATALPERARAAQQELAAGAEQDRLQRSDRLEPGAEVAGIVGVEAGAAAMQRPDLGRRQAADHRALGGRADRLQVGQQLIGPDRGPARDRKRRRRAALGAVDEVREKHLAAVLGQDQQAALDDQVGCVGEVGARELDALARFGLDVDPGAGLGRPDQDLRPGKRDLMQRHTGGAGARDLGQLLVADPGQDRLREFASARIDEHRDVGAVVAALAVADLVVEALQARRDRRESHRAVRIEGHPAARRLAGREQVERIAVRVAVVLQDRDAEGRTLGGGRADVRRLRGPVGRLVAGRPPPARRLRPAPRSRPAPDRPTADQPSSSPSPRPSGWRVTAISP